MITTTWWVQPTDQDFADAFDRERTRILREGETTWQGRAVDRLARAQLRRDNARPRPLVGVAR